MLERAEYVMKSMEDVRRLIREHGWALLVVGSSGDLRAAHVPCLLDPVHDAGGAAEQLVIIGHTARADPVISELLSGQAVLLVFQGPQRVHLTRLVRRGPIRADLELHRRARPRDPRGPRRRGGVLGPRAHGRALRGRPGRPVGAARGRAGIRTADRTRDGSLPSPLSGDPGQGEAEPGQAAPDPGPRDRGAPRGRPVPERAARRRNATRPRESTRTASPTKDQGGAPTAQLSVVREDATAPVVAQVTVEVADVDAVHAQAVRRGLELVYPLTDEPWGAALPHQGPQRVVLTWPVTVATPRRPDGEGSALQRRGLRPKGAKRPLRGASCRPGAARSSSPPGADGSRASWRLRPSGHIPCDGCTTAPRTLGSPLDPA
jgi:Putative FMN-binding domain